MPDVSRVAGAGLRHLGIGGRFSPAGGDIAQYVCDDHTMPHALVTHNRFWLSANPHQPQLMHDFLNFNVPPASEVAGTCISP